MAAAICKYCGTVVKHPNTVFSQTTTFACPKCGAQVEYVGQNTKQ